MCFAYYEILLQGPTTRSLRSCRRLRSPSERVSLCRDRTPIFQKTCSWLFITTWYLRSFRKQGGAGSGAGTAPGAGCRTIWYLLLEICSRVLTRTCTMRHLPTS